MAVLIATVVCPKGVFVEQYAVFVLFRAYSVLLVTSFQSWVFMGVCGVISASCYATFWIVVRGYQVGYWIDGRDLKFCLAARPIVAAENHLKIVHKNVW